MCLKTLELIWQDQLTFFWRIIVKYRKLGKSGLLVSEIGIGCSGFWGDRKFPEQEAAKIILEAIQLGVNFFDTGHNYCNYNAEPRLGRILKPVFTTKKRSDLIISSKAGTTRGQAKLFRPSKNHSIKNFSPNYIEECCKKSIQNLNCDYLDIFQLHGISKKHVTDGLIERLEAMKSRGLFRYLGVNTHRSEDMLFIAKHPEIFDAVLIDYNVLQIDREPIIAKLNEAGIGVIAGTVLAQGHLIKGKIGSLKSLADIWYLARATLKQTGRTLRINSHAMRETLSTIPGMTSAQAATSYVLNNKNICSCIFGTTKIKNLKEIVSSIEKKLTNHDLRSITNVYLQSKLKISK